MKEYLENYKRIAGKGDKCRVMARGSRNEGQLIVLHHKLGST